MQYPYCGTVFACYDLSSFKTTVIDKVDVYEDTKVMQNKGIKDVFIHNKTGLCIVGYLFNPIVVAERKKERFAGCVAQVIKLYDLSTTVAMTLTSKRIIGIPSFRLLVDIQDQVP